MNLNKPLTEVWLAGDNLYKRQACSAAVEASTKSIPFHKPEEKDAICNTCKKAYPNCGELPEFENKVPVKCKGHKKGEKPENKPSKKKGAKDKK